MDDLITSVLKKPKKEKTPQIIGWLTSMNDLIALILTFFVMLFAISEITGKTEITLRLIRTSFEEQDLRVRETLFRQRTVEDIILDNTYSSGYIFNLIDSEFQQNTIFDQFSVSLDRTYIVISLPTDTSFASGSVGISQPLRASLESLTALLSRFNCDITVIGHADPNPIATRIFSDNWDLTLSRAEIVAAVLKTNAFPGDVRVTGRSYGSLYNIPENMPQAQRYQLARRIDIVLNSQEKLPLDQLSPAF